MAPCDGPCTLRCAKGAWALLNVPLGVSGLDPGTSMQGGEFGYPSGHRASCTCTVAYLIAPLICMTQHLHSWTPIVPVALNLGQPMFSDVSNVCAAFASRYMVEPIRADK